MKVLVTGSSGLIGSELVGSLESDHRAEHIVGIDNNMRADFFGQEGDTLWNLQRLRATTQHFRHRQVDIRNREGLTQLFQAEGPFDLVIHCAAQPSHDLAASRPFDDFDVNAVVLWMSWKPYGSIVSTPVFVFLSTTTRSTATLPTNFVSRNWSSAGVQPWRWAPEFVLDSGSV